MFDPARDDDPGNEPFYRRLFTIVLIGVVAAIALWPSVSGFEIGPDATHACVAIRDAFRDPPVTVSDQAPDCGPPARHRIIVTGLGLGMIGVAVGGAAVARARRRPTSTNLRGKAPPERAFATQVRD
jgi:hypothetical protein